MKIYDIDQLKKDSSGNYDLTQPTFQFTQASYGVYTVQRGEEMRMDLVCESIYNDVDHIDILCNINNIDNPLNIKEGQQILYVLDKNTIGLMRYSDVETQDVKSLGNSNKSTRKDSNRKKYIEDKLSLPPTILEKRVDQFNVDNGRIVLGANLFNK